MPLPKGDDPKTIATNIKIAQDNMHLPHNAAVAVALKQAGKQEQPAAANRAETKQQ